MKAMATKKLLAAAMAAAMTIGACSVAGAFEVTVPEVVELTDEEIPLRFWDIWPEGQPMVSSGTQKVPAAGSISSFTKAPSRPWMHGLSKTMRETSSPATTFFW